MTVAIYFGYLYVLVGLALWFMSGDSQNSPISNLLTLLGCGVFWLPCLIYGGYVKRK